MPISLRKRPPPLRCCFDDHRVRKPAILPSFRREFHFHFPPPPPIPSKEHDLWMHHHHHFSSLPLLNYQKKERKKAGFVSEVSAAGALFISHIFFASLSLQRPASPSPMRRPTVTDITHNKTFVAVGNNFTTGHGPRPSPSLPYPIRRYPFPLALLLLLLMENFPG